MEKEQALLRDVLSKHPNHIIIAVLDGMYVGFGILEFNNTSNNLKLAVHGHHQKDWIPLGIINACFDMIPKNSRRESRIDWIGRHQVDLIENLSTLGYALADSSAFTNEMAFADLIYQTAHKPS